VKEYLDLGHGHDARIVRSRDGQCRICPGLDGHPFPSSVDVQTPTAPRHVATPRTITPTRAPVTPIKTGVSVAAIEDVPAIALPGIEVAAPTTAGRAPIAVPTTPAPIAVRPPPPSPPPAPPIQRRPPPPTPPPGAMPRAASPTPATGDASTWEPAPHRSASSVGPSILRWLMWLGIAALVFQLVSLALRPLRRFLTLRHLRRPFWDETVAQQVSNAWQLALVGLRDAGWRPGAGEAPQELARRVGVDGLERCATILERARHGIGIDADDISAMSTSADAAYHAARSGLGSTARVIGWLRWPLT
jgi:hypothetical protein